MICPGYKNVCRDKDDQRLLQKFSRRVRSGKVVSHAHGPGILFTGPVKNLGVGDEGPATIQRGACSGGVAASPRVKVEGSAPGIVEAS